MLFFHQAGQQFGKQFRTWGLLTMLRVDPPKNQHEKRMSNEESKSRRLVTLLHTVDGSKILHHLGCIKP